MTFSREVVGRKGQPEANGGGVGAIITKRRSGRTDGRTAAAKGRVGDGVGIVVGFSYGF